MNANQIEILSRLFLAFNKGIVVETIGDSMVLKTPHRITNPIQFTSSNIHRMVAFLWQKAKNRNLVLVDDHRTHKVIVTPYNDNGTAKFAMQIELKSKDIGYQCVGYVENLLMTEHKVVKTYLANSPRAVLNTMSMDWMNHLKSILNEFNSCDFSVA